MNTFSEAAVRKCFAKKVLLKILQYSELKKSIPEKWDPGLGTRGPGPIRGTRDSGPTTWVPSSGIQDPGPIGKTWNLYI